MTYYTYGSYTASNPIALACDVFGTFPVLTGLALLATMVVGTILACVVFGISGEG